MVLSPIHFAPSIAAAILTILLAFTKHDRSHKPLAYGMAFFAVIGFVGFILGDWTQLLGLSFHSVHAWVGLLTLTTAVATFLLKSRYPSLHCLLGRSAGILALISLAMGLLILFGLTPVIGTSASTVPLQYQASNKLPEVEAKEFMNTTLAPISSQGNNAIIGTQFIDRGAYNLEVTGMVNKTLT